jgi:hypothetical protein
MKMKHEVLARFAGKCSKWAAEVATVKTSHATFCFTYAASSVKDIISPISSSSSRHDDLSGSSKRNDHTYSSSLAVRNLLGPESFVPPSFGSGKTANQRCVRQDFGVVNIQLLLKLPRIS